MIHTTAEVCRDVSCLYYSMTGTGYLIMIMILISKQKKKKRKNTGDNILAAISSFDINIFDQKN